MEMGKLFGRSTWKEFICRHLENKIIKCFMRETRVSQILSGHDNRKYKVTII